MDYERAGLLCHVYRSVSGVHGFLFVMAMSQTQIQACTDGHLADVICKGKL